MVLKMQSTILPHWASGEFECTSAQKKDSSAVRAPLFYYTILPYYTTILYYHAILPCYTAPGDALTPAPTPRGLQMKLLTRSRPTLHHITPHYITLDCILHCITSPLFYTTTPYKTSIRR